MRIFVWAVLSLVIACWLATGIAGIAAHKPRPIGGTLLCQPGSSKCQAGLQGRRDLLSGLEIPGKNFKTPFWVPAFGTEPKKAPIH